ncbi:MAG: preprotein translocase subunit Sec61beta [Candidatus Brockarchaeota archaeon]|nr:preprotein translocase subunit Sec61beta [Candidatus Brockarchaeota archaeon]
MARKKARSKEAPMPAASAGLLRFFEEESGGFKIRPEIVILLSIALMVLSIVAPLFIKI